MGSGRSGPTSAPNGQPRAVNAAWYVTTPHANDSPKVRAWKYAGGTSCSTRPVSGWKPTRFEHAKAAFRLDGAHRAVACVACHPSETVAGKKVVRYRPLGRECADCHAGEPVAGTSR